MIMGMAHRTVFLPYHPHTILNKGKRPDHWFWTRYSAYPYLGCQHGCEFCYCRERKYSPYDDIDDFSHLIKVKENAPDLLRRALQRAPVDMIFTADYQPVERKFGISRKILEVCLELGFPVFILERSPLILRDLDLIAAIHARARAVTAFSIIYTPESPEAGRIRQMEHLAPPPEKRFAAMEKLAAAGIPTGTCLMPVLPGLCDDLANLEAVVRWTANHGGQFVLYGGLTLSDQQRSYFFSVLAERFPDLLDYYRSIYPPGSYAAQCHKTPDPAQRVREFCQKYGIRDRIPRPIIPGDKRTLNKLIVEVLANQAYTAELEKEPGYRVWNYRKAAWAIEDLEQDIRLVYNQLGVRGLQSIPGLSPALLKPIEKWIRQGLPGSNAAAGKLLAPLAEERYE
jgi:DNA repair photolyase